MSVTGEDLIESLTERIARLGQAGRERLATRLAGPIAGPLTRPPSAAGAVRAGKARDGAQRSEEPPGNPAESDPGVLVAHYVTRTGAPLTPQELRSFLGASLPDHLIPPVFSPMEQIPRTKRGKVDKSRLPNPFSPATSPSEEAGEERATWTETEGHLREIWRAVLGVERLKKQDSFFEIGGDSLLGIQLLGRIRDRWRTEVSMEALFDHPTLTEMASYIEAVCWARASSMSSDGDESEAGDREEIEL